MLRGPDDIPPLRPPHAELPPTFWEQHGLWVIVAGSRSLLALVGAAVWCLLRPKPPADRAAGSSGPRRRWSRCASNRKTARC